MKKILFALLLILSIVQAKQDTGVGKQGIALESSPAFERNGVHVDMFNIVRAETAKYFAEETILSGGNTMRHERNGVDPKTATVIRTNFDLVYSYGVYDVSKGLEISVPKYDLFQIVQVFDENHVTIAVIYPGQRVKLSQKDVTYGNHVYLFMRTQKRTNTQEGTAELNKRQDAVVIKAQSSKPYVSEVKYDTVSFNKLRYHLLTTGLKIVKIHKGFVEKIDDIVFPHYQITNLGGWGGLPAKHAFYFVVLPKGQKAINGECSTTTFNPPPVQTDKNGYWSLTLYDKEGWVKTDQYFINSHTAKANKDGSYTLHFNCGDNAINNLKVVKNWNGLFRSYLPESVESILKFKKEFLKHRPSVK